MIELVSALRASHPFPQGLVTAFMLARVSSWALCVPVLLAICACSRCFPTKVVPIWTRPYTEEHHAKIVASYFRYAVGDWSEVGVADVSPDGWVGQRDPMIVVVGRK